MNMENYLPLLLIFGAILGVVGFIVSCICVAICVGMMKATHTIQYVPAETNPELEKFLRDPLGEQDADIDKELELAGKKRSSVLQPIDNAVESVATSDISI